MCDAGAITSAVLTIGSIITDSSDRNKAAKKNKKAAGLALNLENRDISVRELQERIAAAQETEAIKQQTAGVSGAVSTEAASGNVGGMLVDMLMQDVNNQGLLAQDRVGQQLDSTIGSLNRERESAYAAYKGRRAAIAPTNPVAAGLRIVGAGVNAYTDYRIRTRPPVTPSGTP